MASQRVVICIKKREECWTSAHTRYAYTGNSLNLANAASLEKMGVSSSIAPTLSEDTACPPYWNA